MVIASGYPRNRKPIHGMYVRWTVRSDSPFADSQTHGLAGFGFKNNIELWMDATVALYLEALELSYDKLDVPGIPNGADDLVSRVVFV